MPDGPCVLVCLTCADHDAAQGLDPPAIPFPDYRARGKWASEHTRGTGHDRWLCLDVPPVDDPGRS